MAELLKYILTNANFDKLMVALACVGTGYLFTENWEKWTILNAVIFVIIAYVIIGLICYLWKKFFNTDKEFENEKDKEWQNNVRSFWGSLSTENRKKLIELYEILDSDPVFRNRKFTNDMSKIRLILEVNYLDYGVSKPYVSMPGYHTEPCITFQEQNGTYSVVFDPVICEEIQKEIQKDKARESQKQKDESLMGSLLTNQGKM